jgi:hypothetical protein
MVDLELPVETDEGIKTVTLRVDNSVPAHKNKEFFTGFCYMMATANKKESLDKMEMWILRQACKNHNIYPNELYHAYWEAIGDEFVSKEGIEFKNLFKYVKKHRANTYKVPPEPETMQEYQERIVSGGAENIRKLKERGPKSLGSLMPEYRKNNDSRF